MTKKSSRSQCQKYLVSFNPLKTAQRNGVIVRIYIYFFFVEWLRAGSTSLTGLFYYAGHGYEHAGRNYLVAVDAPQPYRPENCVCVQRVMLSMQKKHTALSVILLDTCRKWFVPLHAVNIGCFLSKRSVVIAIYDLYVWLLLCSPLYSIGIIRTAYRHASRH